MTEPSDKRPGDIAADDSSSSRSGKSFGVAPSPFNAVKLEVALLLIMGLLLLVGLDSITQNTLIQFAVLFIFGVIGMVWLMWRTRRVVRRQGNAAGASRGVNADEAP